ncbi:Putative thiosulfate sulfurtransferase SseB [Achromobacter anxifer]|uniref:Sulfurtransferase n=1 Tax=Achromobacter anxifer TaxID=1287737 RepID=A0A6S7CBT9_9BURK|nr:sulfurtransferase [Achromobacter anxifer]CAB3840452.1 Putative thiosulfate sulfurtransferase SseB [Achromobacter anxifer]CAB5516670.1 Putative thiosulfate sulfurtransferase SseB [Achromobacter anxifer]
MYATLISASDLHRLLTQPRRDDVVVLDCGFDLTDAQAGRRHHDAGHIPSAAYVHLDDTLSGVKSGANGRHPLPDRAGFARSMAVLGVGRQTQVVAYDNAGGMFAARLWWLLRWIGHEAVAVLDGGQGAWTTAGYPLTSDPALQRPAGDLPVRDSLQRTLDYAQLRQALETGDCLVLDARSPDRYRGENETLDRMGGHIPGARNRFFRDNLGPDGRFLAPARLREAFASHLNGRAPADVVNQCGSGVTACHNLLAMEVAGLKEAALYPGSWSEWSAQPGAPVATGPNA